MTTLGVSHVLKRVTALFPGPLVALGGGGYHIDSVARSWTLAWGILLGRDLDDALPEDYIAERAKYGATGDGQMTLRDPALDPPPDQVGQHRHLNQVLGFFAERGILPR